MKINIKTKVALIVLLLIFPFIAVYLWAAATFQPQFDLYVRESFEGGWGIFCALYYISILTASPCLWMWLTED